MLTVRGGMEWRGDSLFMDHPCSLGVVSVVHRHKIGVGKDCVGAKSGKTPSFADSKIRS